MKANYGTEHSLIESIYIYVDLEIFDPTEPVSLDCIRLCLINILQKELEHTMQTNGITICFRQTKTTLHHLKRV